MSHSNRDRLVAKVQNMLDSNRYHANPNDQSIAMLKRIFRIEQVEHRTIWSKKFDYMMVSLHEPKCRRSVIYPNAVEVSFRLLYVRMIKEHLGDLKINHIRLKDWYNAIQKMKSVLDKGARTILTPDEYHNRQVLKLMIHQTYYILHIAGLIDMQHIYKVRSEVAKMLKSCIELNSDDWLVHSVFGSEIIMSQVPIREKVEGDVGFRVKYESKDIILPEHGVADVTKYESVFVLSNRQYILNSTGAEIQGFMRNKSATAGHARHYMDNLQSTINTAKMEYNV
ncbi:hypothetical protein VP150E351_P0151 [Vibrio phage 150E35-1]|nr:hypothetical protein VP150E351_P0151 [Vibrio phage 150E35-1]